jgi:hypothetical protein
MLYGLHNEFSSYAANFSLQSLVLVIVHWCMVCAQQTFFVSPSGNDTSGDGSISNPWATVPRAQEAVREINSGMTADVNVYLRSGYYYTSGLNFTQAVIMLNSEIGTTYGKLQ